MAKIGIYTQRGDVTMKKTQKKTQFSVRNVKKSHLFAIFVAICAIFLLIMLSGCVKHTDPVDTIANTAHQQIVAIRESLTPECKTTAIDEQLKAHDSTVDSIKAMCDTQKSALNAEKLRWQWAFFALVTAIGLYVARKILK